MREAAKLGFAKGYGPSDARTGSSKLDYRGLKQLSNLVDQVMHTQ
jgi:DNA repair protein RadA/Sms